MSKSYIIRQHNSIHEFVKAAKKRANKNKASHRGGGGGFDSDWAGTGSFDEAVQFAMYGGWEPEFAPQFRHVLDDLVPKLRKFTDLDLERFPGPVGDEVNVAMFLEGDPDHMVDWVPQENEVQRRALCLIIGHSVSSGCSATELFVRGQAIVGLVRALSLLGFELEIWSEETVGAVERRVGRPEDYSVLTRLHAAGEIMDESAIEFAIGNPAWLRRLLFGFQEGEPEDIRKDFGFGEGWANYGNVRDIAHANLVGADLQLNLGQTWFNERQARMASEDSIRQVAEAGVDWIVDQLKKLGVLDQDATLEWDV